MTDNNVGPSNDEKKADTVTSSDTESNLETSATTDNSASVENVSANNWSERKSAYASAGNPNEKQKEASNTDSGMDQNLAGSLCYVVGLITGIIFLFIEKENRFVRYHAWHSIIVYASIIVLFILLTILSTVVAVIPLVGWILSILGTLLGVVLGLGSFVLWIYLMYQAYQGKMVKLPFAGDFAEKQLNK